VEMVAQPKKRKSRRKRRMTSLSSLAARKAHDRAATPTPAADMEEIGPPVSDKSTWSLQKDPRSGDLFHHNESSGESRWTSSHWVLAVDPETGDEFGYNESTGEKEWVEDYGGDHEAAAEGGDGVLEAHANPMYAH
jgi:hypothetical protein